MITKSKKRFYFVSMLSLLITSCVGTVTNNIDTKIDAKIDSKVNANANIQANANANLSTNVTTGDIKTNVVTDNKVKKALSISVSPSSFTINVGDEIRLFGTVKYDNDTIDNNVVWFSSNSSITKVNQDSGLLNALSEGKIQITATSKSDASINTIINITVNNKYSIRENPLPSFIPAPTPTSTPLTTSLPTIIPTPMLTPIPSVTSDINEKVPFNGKVFDTSGVPVDDAIVTAKSLDPAVSWTGEPQRTQSGAYVFRNAPVGARLEITAKKDGWTTRSRTEMLKSNLTGAPKANVFDFGNGNGALGTDPNNLYGIQDKPEVTMLKINGKIASDSDGASTLNPNPRKPDGLSPNLTNISSDSLTVEMTFSEPVRRDDVENYFRIFSQANFNNRASNFTIDRNLSSVSFVWAADDSSVTFKTSKAILSNRIGDEARYLVDFTNGFRDKTDKASKVNRHFRFSPSKINDFHVFSVKNQDADPFITNIQAIDGGSSNDTVKITFSKPMYVINQTVPQALLADPTDSTTANDSTIQLFAYNTNNGAGANNATILGYKEKASGNFKAVYSIARLASGDLQAAVTAKSGANLWTKGLNGGFANNFTQYGGAASPLKSAKVDNNMITIELNPQAFDKDDRLIVSAGKTVDGRYDDKINNVIKASLKATLPVNGSDFFKITDPAGRPLDSSNSSTLANIDINNAQRVATAN